jgi:hypothetical protein
MCIGRPEYSASKATHVLYLQFCKSFSRCIFGLLYTDPCHKIQQGPRGAVVRSQHNFLFLVVQLIFNKCFFNVMACVQIDTRL